MFRQPQLIHQNLTSFFYDANSHGNTGQDSGRSQSKKGQSEDIGRNIFCKFGHTQLSFVMRSFDNSNIYHSQEE